MSPQSDKAYAMYLYFIDADGNEFTPTLFNLTTPYTTTKNASSYSATESALENFVLTDYISFQRFRRSPLYIYFYRYGDSACTTKFYWSLSLSRTNLVPLP
jgi:hypothetical protein